MNDKIKSFSLSRDLPDVDDDKIESLTARQEGRSPDPAPIAEDQQTEPPRAPQKGRDAVDKPTPADECTRTNVDLPDYLLDEVYFKTRKDRSSLRYEIMRGLKRIGYSVKDGDLVKDRRRKKKK